MIGRSLPPSPCGIHHTHTWPCIHCARAAVHNAAALAGVRATHKNGQPAKRISDKERYGMWRRGNAQERAVRKAVPYPKQAAG